MEQQEIENMQAAFAALEYANMKADNRGGVKCARGMIAFQDGIWEYIKENIWKNALFRVEPSPQFDMQQNILEAADEYLLLKIQRIREDDDDYEGSDIEIAIAHYGPFVVNKDGSIDYGANAQYHHSEKWHENEHHFSHMFGKNWVCASLEDYMQALAHSAKMQGVKSFTINVERISTK